MLTPRSKKSHKSSVENWRERAAAKSMAKLHVSKSRVREQMCKMRSVERFKKKILSQHKYETCSVQKWKKDEERCWWWRWWWLQRTDGILSCNFSPLNFMQYLPSLECHAKLLFHSISRITYTNSSTPSHSVSPSVWKLQLLGNFGSVLAILSCIALFSTVWARDSICAWIRLEKTALAAAPDDGEKIN